MTRNEAALVVGLMALHDREFFERLLKDPRPALEDMVRKEALKLNKKNVDDVVQMVKTAVGKHAPAQGLALWDRWRESGQLQTADWDPGRWII